MSQPVPRTPLISGLVSVILPVFNRPDFLREAVAQVFAQTYRPLELILVDDGSTDETGAVCDEIATVNQQIVRVVHRENGGPGAARESGRLLARGEFLQYFDSDDQIDPRKLEVQVDALRSHPDCGVAYCKTRELTRGEPHDGRASQLTGESLDQLFPRLLACRCWQTVTPLIRREVSDAVGPWSSLRQEEDWEYDSRIAAARTRLVYCEEFLASFVHHAELRASGAGLPDLAKLRDRSEAQALILASCLRADVPESAPCRQHFAQGLFLLARQCGACGLISESKKLLAASCQAEGSHRSCRLRLYLLAARLVGSGRVAKICRTFDSIRSAYRRSFSSHGQGARQ